MKNLNQYLRHSLKLSQSENILERLKLTKDSKLITYNFFPKDFDELRSLIKELLEKRGKDADLNDIDVSKVESFYNSKADLGLFEKLDPHNIDINKWDVSNVTNMRGAFYKCENFDCDLSKWNVSKVEDMRWMFYNCKNFNCNLSNWNVSNVKNMNAMFNGCTEFNCDLSSWDVSNVKDMVCMFNECTKFTGQGLENWNVKRVWDMTYMFDDCDSLKNIPSWYKK